MIYYVNYTTLYNMLRTRKYEWVFEFLFTCEIYITLQYTNKEVYSSSKRVERTKCIKTRHIRSICDCTYDVFSLFIVTNFSKTATVQLHIILFYSFLAKIWIHFNFFHLSQMYMFFYVLINNFKFLHNKNFLVFR